LDKIHEIAKEETFIKSLKTHVKDKRVVFSTGLDKCTLDPNEPKKSIDYYNLAGEIYYKFGDDLNYAESKYKLAQLYLEFKPFITY